MITPADAAEVMRMVAACHPRTAPRMDDREAATVMATVWAELFTTPYNLELADLLAGVKRRVAEGFADSPEPAEIITYARKVRLERDAKTGPTDEYQRLCESKGADTRELANQRRLAALVAGVAERKAIGDA